VIWTDDEDLPAGHEPPAWLVHFRRTLAAIERERKLATWQRDSWVLAEARRIERERERAARGQEGGDR
jgi:hypothetical protein